MTDKMTLQRIYDRMLHEHGESPDLPYMRRLREIIAATPIPKIFLICDPCESGRWTGRAIREDGVVLAALISSSLWWLQQDLIRQLPDSRWLQYEIINLIGKSKEVS